ncbi:MAG: hypothetical protein QNK30_12000 [Bacteroidales bacterium]|nr:hypothetical protein [Bacteroidales bacterium]
MKNPKNALLLILGFSLIVLLFTFGDFLALHDIKQDYVSPFVLEDIGNGIGENLPDWTLAKMEWGLAQVSFYFKFILMTFNVIALTLVFKKLYITNNS